DEAATYCGSLPPGLTTELAPVREALAGIARSLAGHIPGRPVPAPAAPPAELGPLLAEALELSRTSAGSTPGDDASAGLADLFGRAYLVLETGNRSEPDQTAAATAARVVNSVLRPLAAALGPGSGVLPAERAAVTDSPAELARDAALFATRLRARLADAAPPGLLEATAA